MKRHNKRILFISQTASPEGGIETWLDNVCVSLASNGWEPIVGLVRGAKAHCPKKFMKQHPLLNSIEIDGRGLNAEGRVHEVLRCLQKVDPNICVPLTVVDAHEAVACAKWQGARFRYLLTICGNVPAQIADAMRYQAFADLGVCPGGLTCKLLNFAGMPDERIRHVPNGARDPAHSRRNRPLGAPIRLGYVGRLAGGEKRVQDLGLLLEELERNSVDYVFTVAGDGALRVDLESKVRELGIESRVAFLGRLSQDELYSKVYPYLDVLTSFSKSEAFGISLVEAMMHGIVPVSTRFIGHIAEGFLQDSRTALLFDTGDIEQAVKNIDKLCHDHCLFERLSEQAQDTVQQRYSWKACCENWLAAFAEIMQQPARIGTQLDRRPGTGLGRLVKLGVPESMVFSLRRLRRTVLGVPQSMVGGEEWPFANRFHPDSTLQKIEQLSLQLDHAAATNSN